MSKKILSGDQAVAEAALVSGITLGSGYPGTPSSEILDHLSSIGGNAEWSPNEKVALEVGIGVAFGGGRSMVTMKHVGLNVAADPLFTVAYTGTRGGLIIVSADDPGMASSQNEQDNREYARSARLAMFEPSDSQEAYDFTIKAFEYSERYKVPVLLRMTTRVCHSMSPVDLWKTASAPVTEQTFVNEPQTRIMVPAFAKKAHVRVEALMKDLESAPEQDYFTVVKKGDDSELGIICSGVSFLHASEAAPSANILKLGQTWPLPYAKIAEFAKSVKHCIVVEEGDRFLSDAIRARGINVEEKPYDALLGELNVERVRKQIAKDSSPMPVPAPGRPPQLCPGCPHRKSFEGLRDLGCIVAGDIGCYTLGMMPPFNAIHTTVCMGASIGVGLGLRRSLKEEDARKVVSVIGDSTFMHSGLTGIAEMVYNRPATGHLVIILDNATTAMTGFQEHSATGRKLDMSPAKQIDIAEVCRAMGADNVDIVDSTAEHERYKELITERLKSNDVSVIIARRPCLLQIKKLAKFAKGGVK